MISVLKIPGVVWRETSTSVEHLPCELEDLL